MLLGRRRAMMSEVEIIDIKTYQDIIKSLKKPSAEDMIGKVIINDEWTNSNNVKYNCPTRVVDVRIVEDQDGNQHKAAIMQRVYATDEDVQFDALEGEVCSQTTEPNALPDVYYYGITGKTYTSLSIKTGDPIPYSSYDTIEKDSIKDTACNILRYGYNRYKVSAVRQYLNSSGAKGLWWESTHVGDNAPLQLNSLRGYLAGCSQEMIEAAKPIKISCYTNSITDGSVIDDMYDTVWLPSGTEVYGSVNANEGTYFPFWKDATGWTSPNNGNNTSRIIYDISSHTSVCSCWYRSAAHNRSYYNWRVNVTGSLASYYVYSSFRCAPAFAIY